MPTAFEITSRTFRSFYGLWIDTPPVLPRAEYFPEATRFEACWRAIRDEALGVAADLARVPRFHELLDQQASISANDGHDWRMFVLRAYRADQESNLARCPATARLLRALPQVTSAAFSILDGGKHVPAHRGPYRGILRYQLGLVVPKDAEGRPAATLRVDRQLYRWREGEGVLWDDTYEHEVWNEGSTPRIVLLADVERPRMPRVLRWTHRAVFGWVARSKGLQELLAKSEVAAAYSPPSSSKSRARA